MGMGWHPSLTPVPRGEAFNLSLLNTMAAVAFSHVACITLRYVSSVPKLLNIFITKECILSNASIKTIMRFLSYIVYHLPFSDFYT